MTQEQTQNNPIPELKTVLETSRKNFISKPFWQKHWRKFSIVFVLFASVGLVFATTNNRQTTKTTPQKETNTSSSTPKEKECATETATGCIHVSQNYSDAVKAGKLLSGNQCKGEGVPYKLGHSPMDAKDFAFVLPYGIMVGGHVTPIDHQYFAPADYNSPVDSYPVYAMADSNIVDIQTRTNTVHPATEYHIHFAITCTFLYYYDLVTSLSPDILEKYNEAIKENSNTPLNIPVKEGQVIGRIGGRTLDFAVWDTTKKLPGFVIPEHYTETWKIYTADPLNYYTDDLKKFILSKYVRTIEPISGKIDNDIDGKLIGNWFLEGTAGYSSGGMKEGYFSGHLAFAPDHMDPKRFIISIGSLYKVVSDESQMQHMTGNDSVNPKDVGIETGLVKYDLFRWRYKKPDGSLWDNKSFTRGITATTETMEHFGVVLVQLIEPRKIKFELFIGKTSDEVNSFDTKAVVYER